MITYRATLDVPIDTLRAVTGWLREHRRIHDARPWQRAATVYVQAPKERRVDPQVVVGLLVDRHGFP